VDEQGRITRFVEKPPREQAPSNLINAGAWLFEPEAVGQIAAGRFSMVEQELFPALAAAGRLFGYTAAPYWMDAGTPERYLQLHRDLLTGRAACALPLAARSGEPWLRIRPGRGVPGDDDPPATVDPTASVTGPVVLAGSARLGARAAAVGPLSIGSGTVVQEDATVRDSVLWDGCRIEPGARVAGSVLGAGCVVGADAQLRGCVLGDGVHVRPGATLTGVHVDPGETIG
jgi:mannose-1-phosphate guanylyltransferase